MDTSDTKIECEFSKVDRKHGLVFGYAIVCKVDGVDYWDVQDDHIPEYSMLAAATKYMMSDRPIKEMHAGPYKGMVVFAFPITTDIALSTFGFVPKKTGLLIGMKPYDPIVLDKFESGEYTGFSIGGKRITDRVIKEDEYA